MKSTPVTSSPLTFMEESRSKDSATKVYDI